jgi:hypothetical protein
MAKKDYETAYFEKRKQVISLEMYRAAKRATSAVTKTQSYFKKFEKKRVQQRLGKAGVLDDIFAVIEGISFRKASMASIDRKNAMRSLREDVESGRMIVTPETLL